MRKNAILKTTKYVPKHCVFTEDIRSSVGIDNKRYKAVNIHKVHVAIEEDAYDMALKCAKQLFEEFPIDKRSIKYVVYASAVNEYIIADYAMKLCRDLQLANAETMCISQFCCGALVGLEYLDNQLKRSLDNHYGLLITSECFHDVGINRWMAASTLYYGDGASAALIGRASEGLIIEGGYGVTDGRFNDLWKIPVGGLKSNYIDSDEIKKAFKYEFNQNMGEKINTATLFKIMSKGSKKVVHDLLKKYGLTINDINHFIMYNPGEFMQRYLVKSIGIESSKALLETASDYGHMGSTDIIFNLDYLLDKREVKMGEKILIFSMEAGLSFRSLLIQKS